MASSKSYPYSNAPSNDVYSAEGLPIHETDQQGYYNSHNGNNAVVVPVEPAASTYHSRVENPRYVDINSRKSVMLTYCPNCAKQHVSTHTRTKATGTTWVCVVAGVVIFWPLCWLPLVINPMKQTNHYCNGCGKKVGRVKPFQ